MFTDVNTVCSNFCVLNTVGTHSMTKACVVITCCHGVHKGGRGKGGHLPPPGFVNS